MIKILDRGTRALQGLTTSILLNIVPTFFECVIVIGMLCHYFGTGVATIGISGIFFYSIFTILISEWRLSIRTAMNAAELAVSASLLETVTNSESIHTTPNARKFERERHELLLSKYEGCALKTASSLALLNAVQGVLITGSMTGMLALGLSGIATTPGDLVLMQGLLFQLAGPLGFLGTSYREGRQSVADVEAVFDITQKEKTTDFSTLPSSLTILDFSQKKRILLVGSSGGGKSTLARQLAMELGPQAIWVPQDVSQLFSKTVFYNIAYGINFRINSEDIYCRLPDSSTLIIDIVKQAMEATNLPLEILYREVGERGSNLSGGERQRILIARAFARLLSCERDKIKAIILDEPTAWLDGPTESHILEKLFLLAKNIPVLMVTHSIQAIAPFFDHVLVISSNEKEGLNLNSQSKCKSPLIIQEGYWKHLLLVPGPFATLWNSQEKPSKSQ